MSQKIKGDDDVNEPKIFHIIQVADEDLVIDSRAKMTRLEKIDAVEVSDVNTPEKYRSLKHQRANKKTKVAK